MFGRFLEEEKAQAGIEYILLIGGIIAATVVFIAVYSNIGGSAATTLNASTGAKVEEMSNVINQTSLA